MYSYQITPVSCCFFNKYEQTRTQQAAKGDGRRQGGEVDEDDSSKDLGIKGICDVTPVVLVASPDISNHSAKRSTSTGQGIFGWRSGGDGDCEGGDYMDNILVDAICVHLAS